MNSPVIGHFLFTNNEIACRDFQFKMCLQNFSQHGAAYQGWYYQTVYGWLWYNLYLAASLFIIDSKEVEKTFDNVDSALDLILEEGNKTGANYVNHKSFKFLKSTLKELNFGK